MRVALDFDGTITEHPEFFRVLSAALQAQGHEIIILTYRHPALRSVMAEQLTAWGISFTRFQFAHSQQDKSVWCEVLGIDVFFEDSDECIFPVGARTLVFKVRNARNFDFDRGTWIGRGSAPANDVSGA